MVLDDEHVPYSVIVLLALVCFGIHCRSSIHPPLTDSFRILSPPLRPKHQSGLSAYNLTTAGGMPPSSLYDLPLEVLRQIPVQADDLLSLVLVNRHLNSAYTPRIYETVDFISTLSCHRQQLTSLIRTVAASPQLAAHVRKLDLQREQFHLHESGRSHCR
jgi:hypothetical protein